MSSLHRSAPETFNTPDFRVYLVGAHSTGKTTLARYIRDHYGLPMISEVARSILAELEISLDRLRSDVDAVSRYQREVFLRQIEAERKMKSPFVSDRAFCNLAYMANHALNMSEVFRDPILDEYMKSVAEGVVFFMRPHRDLLVEDGVRAGVCWEEVITIDGMVKLFLELWGIPYVTLSALSMQERVRTIDAVLNLRMAGGKMRGAFPPVAQIVTPARVNGN
ncbi:MAG: ATP-binding protein [Planctomycetes bacterium]|nr:ATP-binding protein [Planctomycetota bacterium]